MDLTIKTALSPSMQFLGGEGEMATLTRRYDWSQSSVGPFDKWPQSLKTIVSMLLHSDFPMFLWWGADMIQFYNDAYRPSLGQTGKHPRALGQRGEECWPEIWDTIFPLIDQVRTTRKSFFIEDSLIPIYRNGALEDVYWTFSYSAIIGEAGDVDGVLVVCNETTKKVTAFHEIERSERRLKASEARFQSLVSDATAAIVVLIGPEMKVEIANDAYGRLINLKADDLIGKPLFSIIPDAEEYYRPLLEKVRQTGEPLFLSDSPYSVDTNGQTTSGFLHVVYQPYRNVEGTILGVMAILQDVTEQVKAVQRLKESESRLRNLSEKLEEEVELRTRELKQSNEDLQQFAHVASHDLKEPVRKIKTFAGRLQDELGDALGSRGAVYLQKVQQATSRMVSMIDGVLAYSSINATRLAPEEIDLNTVLENIKTDLEVVIQQRGAQVLYDDLPRLQGAPVLIYQLFYNLINNSIKFTQPDCPAIVKVESAIVSHAGKKAARISVRDNGIGFDEKYARNIFNTFTRLNSKDQYEGTGLGLALCKKIVERHDGSIDASSIKSEGATFTITLPLKQTHEI